MPPTASSASTADKGGGRAAATTNAIIEAAMREIVRCKIISMTVNDDDGINVVTMINADNGSSFGPTIAGAHLVSVADAPSGPARPRPALGFSVGLLMAVIAAAMLAFVLIRQCSLRGSNSCKRMTDGVEDEEWGGEAEGGTITVSDSRTEKTEETRTRLSPRIMAEEKGGMVVRPTLSTRQTMMTMTTG